jgi:Fe-S cluster biogenesis protein NfuA
MISIESVEKAIDNIRPYLMADGGNIKVLEITEDQVVKVEMLGSCGDCRMSSMTLKAGVEDAIRQAFPEIKRVEAVNIFSETV